MSKRISNLLFLLFPNNKHIPIDARSWPAFFAHASYQNSDSSPMISSLKYPENCISQNKLENFQ